MRAPGGRWTAAAAIAGVASRNSLRVEGITTRMLPDGLVLVQARSSETMGLRAGSRKRGCNAVMKWRNPALFIEWERVCVGIAGLGAWRALDGLSATVTPPV